MSRLGDESFVPANDTPDRRTQPFRKTHRHAIKALAIFPEPSRTRGDSLPQARAVEVHPYRRVLSMCPRGDGLRGGEGEDGAAEGVLEPDEASRRVVRVGGCHGVLLDV